MARPTKFQPSYCDQVIEHMTDGASLTSFAAEIGVARSTINEWMEAHSDFADSVRIAKAKCAAWWEKRGRELAVEGGGNAALESAAQHAGNVDEDETEGIGIGMRGHVFFLAYCKGCLLYSAEMNNSQATTAMHGCPAIR